MKKTVAYYQMVGFVFTAVVGTLLHFLFDWTGGNVVVALFSAVNESVWEHLKLLFYPMLGYAIIEYFFLGKNIESYWWIKLIGILIGLVLIPIVYYTYTGILGVKADWFNISLFFLAAGIVYWVETRMFLDAYAYRTSTKVSLLAICLLVAFFTVFTFIPPHIPFFEDPLTGTYGF